LFDAVPLADPLAAMETLLASFTVDTTLLLGAAVLTGLGMLLGPVFCGWVCPLGFLLDLNDGIRRRLTGVLERFKVRGPSFSLPREFRYALFGMALGLSAAAGLPAFQTVSPIHFISRLLVFYPGPALLQDQALLERLGAAARIAAKAGGALLLVLIALFAIEYVAPRVFCRALCPLGAFYGILGRYAPLRVRVRRERECKTSCGRCTLYCPMGIPVKEEFVAAGVEAVDRLECTRCGACVDRCPGRVLRLGFAWRGRRPSPASKEG
jgi:ferredoxin-type protein NapH